MQHLCGSVISMQRSTSKTWTRTMDQDPEKPGPLKIWTLKNLDPDKHGPNKFWTVKYGKISRKICLTLGSYVL